jgi:hypothetical protein
MTTMIRKQIYIEGRQQLLLKRLAQADGVSEAELIRQAIDNRVCMGTRSMQPDPEAWEKAHQFMLELHARGPIHNQPRSWTREELYEERLSRYDRHSD